LAAQFAVDILFKAQTQALDKVGQQLGSTERVAQKLNGTLRDSKGRFIAAGDGAGRAANDIKNFGGAADRAAKSAKALQGSVGALLGALGASLAIGKAISDFRELDTSIRRLATAGGDVKGLDAGLRKLSDQLGGVYSKAELAKAAYQSLSAGFSDTADAMKIVGAASKAAYGGLADQEEVTSVLVKTLNAYGLSASKASQITDIISKSIEVGNVEWSDYTSQLGKVSGMAAVAGVSFQDLNAFIAASTKNGATAEQAFTGLSGLLTGLLQPTKESADAAAALGIDWSLAGLKAKGLSGLLGELSKAQEKDAETAARMVGNTEAMRGTFAAAANGGKTYTDVLNTLGGAAGKTDQDFVTMSASIDAKLRGLSTAFKNAGEAFVKAFGPAIQFVISKLTELLGWMEQVFGRMNDLMNNGGRNTQAALQSRPAAVRELRQKYGLFAEWTHGDKLPALEQKHRDAWLKANPAAAAAKPAAAKPGGTIPALMPATVSGINPAIQAVADGASGTGKGSSKKAPTGIITEYLTGDRSHAGYRADHGGGNYHEHLGFQAPQQMQLAMKALQAAGIKIGSTTGGRHAAGSLHYSGRAFDVPASQVPVGQEQALSQMVRSVLAKAGFEGSGIGGDSGGHINEILDDYANKLAESFQQGQQLTTEFTRQNELLLAGTEEARRRLEIQYQYQDNEQKIAELMDAGQQKELQALNEKLKAAELQKLENELLVEKAQLLESALRPIADENEMLEARLAGTEKELEMKRQIAALTNAGMESGAATNMVQLNQQLKAQVEAQDKAKASAEALAGSISSALTSSLRGLIDGSMTAEEALSNAFKGIGDAFLDMAMQMIQQWLTMQIMGLVGSFFGGAGGSIVGGQNVPLASMPAGMAFASGGSTPTNTPVLVGERGPELFVPGQSGGITNNQNLRSMMNSDRSTSQEGGSGVNLSMSFQTTQFMDREWVDREQLDAAMARAAKTGAERGHQRTLDKLRQSPSTRRRVGI
jgi:TP901 family phage tail tape measure protein